MGERTRLRLDDVVVQQRLNIIHALDDVRLCGSPLRDFKHEADPLALQKRTILLAQHNSFSAAPSDPVTRTLYRTQKILHHAVPCRMTLFQG